MMNTYSARDMADLVPIPSHDAHKYSRGTCTLIAGTSAYPGAACLAALASQKAGAGYTRVVTAACNVALVQSVRPSLVVESFDAWRDSALSPLRDGHPCAYGIGCGFTGAGEEERALLSGILHAEAPVLVDGGALALVGTDGMREALLARAHNGLATVLTPHAGEAAALAAAADITPCADEEAFAAAIARAFGCIAVLKGPRTIVSDATESFVVDRSTPALAKAGTGDVLAGCITALLAQEVQPFDACVLGITLHARAGCLAAKHLGVVSVCAEDVIEYLGEAIEQIVASAD